jgi:hypothetical protein
LLTGGTLTVVGPDHGALPFFPQRALAIRGSYVGTLDELGEVARARTCRQGAAASRSTCPARSRRRPWLTCAPATSAAG